MNQGGGPRYQEQGHFMTASGNGPPQSIRMQHPDSIQMLQQQAQPPQHPMIGTYPPNMSASAPQRPNVPSYSAGNVRETIVSRFSTQS